MTLRFRALGLRWREHRRWGIVAILFLIAALNNLDRQVLSVLAPTLKTRFGFGPVEYSYIVSAFLVAYALGYVFCGRILDRVGVKVGLAAALAFWSFVGLLHAAVVGWVTLAFFRFLLGLGESFNSPGGVKAIREWIPPRERAFSIAIFTNGNIIGAIIAPPLVAFLGVRFGWQWGFIVPGLLGFVLLAVWWRVYDDPVRHPRLTATERTIILEQNGSTLPVATPLTMGQLLRHPLCRGFFIVRLLTDPVAYFFSFWLLDYLQHARGLTLTKVGLIGWIPFLAQDLGGPIGGGVSDWLVRRGCPIARARWLLMLGAGCLMPLACIAVRTEAVGPAIALIGIVLASQGCWMANQLTLISEATGRENVATLMALSALGGSLGGIASTLLAGRAIAGYGYVPVFTGFSFLHLIALGVLRLAQRRAAKSPLPCRPERPLEIQDPL